MSEFFDSELVQEALAEISYLQFKVMEFVSVAPWATIEDQLENIATLRLLLSKQENLYNRCVLSGDEEAKELIEEVCNHFKENGYDTDGKPMYQVFEEIRTKVDEIELEIHQFMEED